MRKYFHAISALTLTAFLSGCASYNASSLKSLASDAIIESHNPDFQDGLVVIAKAFNKDDCKKYLDRDVIKEGYQPIQIYIQNNSTKNYVFSLDRISMCCSRPEEVARKVHTSTAGRAIGYAVGSLFMLPLAIPAVVDAVKSSKANESLDYDFSVKAASDQVIYPSCNLNKILFTRLQGYNSTFDITLIESETNKPRTFRVHAS
ncbi:MAG: hypothetical protein K2Y01_08130 [Rhabdochlamydiaceae bacterium]|nr:hypothetical protein [Rhabdochlamydiaceae bacterium]